MSTTPTPETAAAPIDSTSQVWLVIRSTPIEDQQTWDHQRRLISATNARFDPQARQWWLRWDRVQPRDLTLLARAARTYGTYVAAQRECPECQRWICTHGANEVL